MVRIREEGIQPLQPTTSVKKKEAVMKMNEPEEVQLHVEDKAQLNMDDEAYFGGLLDMSLLGDYEDHMTR